MKDGLDGYNNLDDLAKLNLLGDLRDFVGPKAVVRKEIKSIEINTVTGENLYSFGSLNQGNSKFMDTISSVSAVAEEFAATSEKVCASTEKQIADAETLSNISESLQEMAQALNNAISVFKV